MEWHEETGGRLALFRALGSTRAPVQSGLRSLESHECGARVPSSSATLTIQDNDDVDVGVSSQPTHSPSSNSVHIRLSDLYRRPDIIHRRESTRVVSNWFDVISACFSPRRASLSRRKETFWKTEKVLFESIWYFHAIFLTLRLLWKLEIITLV